jgi:hypothetical protein
MARASCSGSRAGYTSSAMSVSLRVFLGSDLSASTLFDAIFCCDRR